LKKRRTHPIFPVSAIFKGRKDMRRKLWFVFICLMALTLAAGVAWAQMGGGRGMMMQPGQMQQQSQSQTGSGPGYAYGPGMMGMGGRGGGMGMMGAGMMRMMMSHMMGGGGGMMSMGGGMMGMGRMLPYLNLSPQQWDKVRALAYKRLEKMAGLRAKLFQKRLEMANLTSQKSIDPAKVKKLFAKQAELKAEMFLAGWDYLQQVEKILTPEQKKQLQERGYR
jgi:Spy/CpxP family protein refolding chaperone